MKVLILNRRCIRNPQKGGAEIYTFELAKALKEIGAEVEWFSSKIANLKAKEKISGIKFVRRGNELTTHIFGFLYAKKRKDFFIIDEFNGIGFFTFFLKNSLLLIHQLYEEFWTAEFGSTGAIFKIIEKLFLRLYKNHPTITVSPSTADDLKRLGFKDISIIPNGLDITPLESIPEKERKLCLVYLGRLKKTKNPEDAIKAFLEIKKVISDSRLKIIGSGPLLDKLKRLYSDNQIEFLGYVSDREKYLILKKAHFLLVPSIREGWGQVVIQANAMGTPAIGYRVKGLKDSIKDGLTGFLVSDYKEMASKVVEIWNKKELYMRLSGNALSWARNFSWEKTRKEFIDYLSKRGLLR